MNNYQDNSVPPSAMPVADDQGELQKMAQIKKEEKRRIEMEAKLQQIRSSEKKNKNP